MIGHGAFLAACPCVCRHCVYTLYAVFWANEDACLLLSRFSCAVDIQAVDRVMMTSGKQLIEAADERVYGVQGKTFPNRTKRPTRWASTAWNVHSTSTYEPLYTATPSPRRRQVLSGLCHELTGDLPVSLNYNDVGAELIIFIHRKVVEMNKRTTTA